MVKNSAYSTINVKLECVILDLIRILALNMWNNHKKIDRM